MKKSIKYSLLGLLAVIIIALTGASFYMLGLLAETGAQQRERYSRLLRVYAQRVPANQALDR